MGSEPEPLKAPLRQFDRSDSVVIEHLKQGAAYVEQQMLADLIAFVGPIFSGVETAIRTAIEARPSGTRRNAVAVLLQTPGGTIEVVERIANTLRHHYPANVMFVVADYAMSAGTVLVMSGDSIHMDYSSVLGPIDPQVESREGGYVPALGYLEQYKRLVEKSKHGTLTTAELAYLIQKFDPAEMYRFEQHRDLSTALLERWLATFKFKDWVRTETRRLEVTAEMKAARARDIAETLSDTERWKSHSRGISMSTLTSDLGLRIDDFGVNPVKASTIRNYHRILTDFMAGRGHRAVVHSAPTGYVPIA